MTQSSNSQLEICTRQVLIEKNRISHFRFHQNVVFRLCNLEMTIVDHDSKKEYLFIYVYNNIASIQFKI